MRIATGHTALGLPGRARSLRPTFTGENLGIQSLCLFDMVEIAPIYSNALKCIGLGNRLEMIRAQCTP